MTIQVPSFLRDHPVESVLAVALLFCLLFITADGTAPAPLGNGTVMVATEKS